MLTPNVLPFVPRRATGVVVSTPTQFGDPLGWLEIPPAVYDWFIRYPDPATCVHEYGFLHVFTSRAFVCIARQDGEYEGFLCGMSNGIYTPDAFDALRDDDTIDFVIRKLGYEPIST